MNVSLLMILYLMSFRYWSRS